MQPKFVAAQKMLLNRNPANIRNLIVRFYVLGIYTPLEARVLLTLIRHDVYRYGQLSSALLINILGSFQLFLHSDQPL